MKNVITALAISMFAISSCQQSATKEAVKGQQLAKDAIEVHDEIMPQISVFDKTTLKIDSILENLGTMAKSSADVDTALVRTELSTLKSNLESATDVMMTWMKEYDPNNMDINYQHAELEKVKAMKKQFEEVSLESNQKLAKY